MNKKFDAIVLGLGALGSSTLYQLAKRGCNVLGIDQYSPPHNLGSMHGETRLTRQAIGEGVQYTPLSLRSYEIFREIEKETGTNLLEITGGLTISTQHKEGAEAIKLGIKHHTNFFANTVAAAKRFNIKHEILDASEIRQKFPQFKVQDTESGYFEYEAGYLKPEECIKAQMSLAKKYGASIHTNEPVKRLIEIGNGISLKTDLDEYYTDKLIIAAVSWLVSSFADLQILLPLTITRQVLYWYDVSQVFEEFTKEKFPVFLWETQKGRSMYGFPGINGPNGGIKIAPGDHGARSTIENLVRDVSEAEIQDMYENLIEPFFL